MRNNGHLVKYLKKDRQFTKSIERYWIVVILMFIPSCTSIPSTLIAISDKDWFSLFKAFMILWFFAQAIRGLSNLYTARREFRFAPNKKLSSQLPDGLNWPPIMGIYYGDF